MKIDPRRKRQFYGIIIGLVLGISIVVVLFMPKYESCTMPGAMNTGHENLSCNECHTPAKGTPGQQIQTNISYLFGMRKTPVTFGLENVDNVKCKACHDRPNDRHPVHRFEEPRFAAARKNIRPTECISCHREHNSVRVTIGNPGYCVNCHKDTKLKNDPLDIPHHELISRSEWNTCLQCHDFHGNHTYKTANLMKDTIALETILRYLKGGPSPYGDKKKYVAKKSILKKQ
jgi:hypothetical protein